MYQQVPPHFCTIKFYLIMKHQLNFFSLLVFFFFGLSNIQSQCWIEDVTAVQTDCDGGQFWATLNFASGNTGNEGFRVQGNGNNYGNFSYADLPVEVGPLEGDGTTIYELVVIDNQFGDCSDFTTIGPVFCGVSDCVIDDLVLEATDCDADNTYDLHIDFNYQNPTHTHFDVIYDGNVVGFFALADLPIVIQNFDDIGEQTPYIQVCINDDPDCCAANEFVAPNCGGGGDCEIWDVEAFDVVCDGDEFTIFLNFNHNAHVGDHGFHVQGNGMDHGNFEYADLPIQLGPFPADGTFWEFIVWDVDFPDCSAFLEFGEVDCGGGNDCEYWDFFAETHPCNDDGLYMLDFEFNAANVGNDGFYVIANGVDYGPFNYGENFYTIGPLHEGVIYEILIQDVAHPDCVYWNEWGPVFCDSECHIYDLHAEVTDCNDDGEFFVWLAFETENVGNGGYKVAGNGNVYGFFEYAENPVKIGPFEPGAFDALEFVVTDHNHPDCGDAIVVPVPDCGGGSNDCSIHDLNVDVTPCLGNGTFYAIIDFEYDNTSNIGFRVDGNGINYGLYSYSDLPISIGPLVGNGTTPYEFVVSDLNVLDCHVGIDVGAIDCDITGDCLISDGLAVPGSCHADGTYNLWLNFDFENSDNIYFDVFYGNQIVDYFPLASLPVVIPHFESNGEPVQEIKVCINDNPDCCLTIEYIDPQCNAPSEIWPGDVNFNAMADHFDILKMGLAFGAEGPARPVQGIEWTSLEGDDWDQQFENGLNFKHADCNGDGIVDGTDVVAIGLNYGETHDTPLPYVNLGGGADDPPFFVDLPGGADMQQGNQFTAPVILGTADLPVNDLHGIAFTLEFDPGIIDPASVGIQYDPSWLGVVGVNLLAFDKKQVNEGKIHIAIARTDQNDVSGFGHVLAFIGIIDNLAGKEEIKVEIKDVRAVQGNEVVIPLNRPVEIVDLTVGTDEPQTGIFKISPNPTHSKAFISHPQGEVIQNMKVFNMNGRLLFSENGPISELDASGLSTGVYILKIETKEGLFVERLVKM